MTTTPAAPYRLSLVGPWQLTGPDGRHVRSVLSQPKRLCLLAYLALAGKPVSRATVVALFWPESDEERARNALSQALHYLRRSLSKDAIESVEGDRLLVRPEVLWFDARVLLDGEGGATGAGGATGVAGRAGAGEPGEVAERSADGPERERERQAIARRAAQGAEFFEGWNADDSQPLQEWLDGVRRELRERAVEVGAEGAGEAGSTAAGRETGREPRAAGVVRGRPGATRLEGDARRDRRWLARALAAAALVVILVVGMVRSGARAESEDVDVAVLMPQIAATDSLHPLSAQAVHAELLARLSGVEGIRVRALPFAESAFELRRFLDAVGDVGAPDLVLSVNARVAGGEVRVVGLLLGGVDYTEAWGTSAATHSFATDADALLGLPEEIARTVIEEVGGGLGSPRR